MSNGAIYTVTISGTEYGKKKDGGSVMLYKVVTNTVNAQYTSLQRFSKFVEIDIKLRNAFKNSPMLKLFPTLPAKKPKIFVDHSNPEFIEERRLELQQYLTRLIQVPQILENPDLLEWLGKNLQEEPKELNRVTEPNKDEQAKLEREKRAEKDKKEREEKEQREKEKEQREKEKEKEKERVLLADMKYEREKQRLEQEIKEKERLLHEVEEKERQEKLKKEKEENNKKEREEKERKDKEERVEKEHKDKEEKEKKEPEEKESQEKLKKR